MSLAKWLAISGTVKRVGGQNRFVLPPAYRARFAFKFAKPNEKRSDVFSDNSREPEEKINRAEILPQKLEQNKNSKESSDINNFNTHQNNVDFIERAEVSNLDLTGSIPIVDAPQKSQEKIVQTKPETVDQLSLDDWKSNSNAISAPVSPQRSYHSVGRWALKRFSKNKIPKPPPVQSEFKFKEIKVARNDLNFSDVEIVVKPKKGFVSHFLYGICSLINRCNGVVKKLTHIVITVITII